MRRGLFAALACALAASSVSAQTDAPRWVSGVSECPSAELVQSEVLKLVPPGKQAGFAGGVQVEIIDLGDSYRIEIERDGIEVGARTHSDPDRDCDKRGRFAALFVALTLMPPELRRDPLRDQYHAAVSVPPPKAQPEPEPEPDLARIEVSGMFAGSPPILGAPWIGSFGGELRVALGRGSVSGTLAVGYMPPASFELGDFEGRIGRMPASAGLRLRAAQEHVELSLDLGALVSLERVEGTSPLFAQSQTTVEFGFRTGGVVAYRAGLGLLPFAGLSVSVIPAPREIATLPRGVIGNTPYLWLGANVGLALSL